MRAIATDSASNLTFLDLSPVLIAADSESARFRAIETVESAGLRAAPVAAIGDLPDRLRLQGAASALWIELDHDAEPALVSILDAVAAEVAAGRCAAIVSARMSLVDTLVARLPDAGVELVIDGDPVARATALAMALSGAHAPRTVHDARNDQDQARLRQLSDEVSRIAASLARLSSGPAQPARVPEPASDEDVPAVSVETVRSVIRARRLRARYFSEELFADPAWDMLLDLLQAELAQLRVPVSSLCIAAAVPATTALRWLKTMTEKGLFVRRADPHDGRRIFVELAPHASVAMRRYFAEVGQPATV